MPIRFNDIKLQEVYDNACRFTNATINPLLVSGKWSEAWQKAGECGLLSACVETEKGGNPLSLSEALAAIEGFAFSCTDGGFVFCVVACWSASVIPLSKNGSSQQINTWLKPLLRGDASCSNAISEQGAGSDIASMSSTAVENNGSYIINANKCFISNANQASYILLYALTNPDKKLMGGVSVFVVLKNEFITTGEYKLSGFDSFSLSELEVKNLTVPSERRLGEEGSGFGIFAQSMNVERMAMSAMHLGIVARMLNQTGDYVSLLQKNQQPLKSIPSVAKTIDTISAGLKDMRNLVFENLDENKVFSERVSSQAARVKLEVSEFAKASLLQLQQLYGATGHVRGVEIEQRVRDVLSATIYSGTSEVMKNLSK